jgi:glycosyltransferase involved in cell wall biosynthesis
VRPVTSTVVHNGLNHPYKRLAPAEAMARLRAAGLVDAPGSNDQSDPGASLLLHVGAGQWYKNTPGVLAIYQAHVFRCRLANAAPQPLWLIGPEPDEALRQRIADLPDGAVVKVHRNLDADVLEALYSLAVALLFPSLAEGFGWPIIEAMACGCPVLTTGAAPMNEIGGSVAFYLPRLKAGHDVDHWAHGAARTIEQLIARTPDEAQRDAQVAMVHAARFNAADAIDRYLAVYAEVLAHELQASQPRLQTAA